MCQWIFQREILKLPSVWWNIFHSEEFLHFFPYLQAPAKLKTTKDSKQGKFFKVFRPMFWKILRITLYTMRAPPPPSLPGLLSKKIAWHERGLGGTGPEKCVRIDFTFLRAALILPRILKIYFQNSPSFSSSSVSLPIAFHLLWFTWLYPLAIHWRNCKEFLAWYCVGGYLLPATFCIFFLPLLFISWFFLIVSFLLRKKHY